jgi:hypothetical protein
LDEDVRHAIDKLSDKMDTAIAGLRDHIDSKFDKLDQKFITKESHDNLKERVASLEADRRKITWLVIGAVLTAILAGVIITKSTTVDFSVPSPTSTVTR